MAAWTVIGISEHGFGARRKPGRKSAWMQHRRSTDRHLVVKLDHMRIEHPYAPVSGAAADAGGIGLAVYAQNAGGPVRCEQLKCSRPTRVVAASRHTVRVFPVLLRIAFDHLVSRPPRRLFLLGATREMPRS